jgi:hypothetical protein
VAALSTGGPGFLASAGMGSLYPYFMTFRFAAAPMSSLRDRFRPAAAPKSDPKAESRAAQVLAGKRGRGQIAPPPGAGKAVTALLKPLLKETGMGFNELKRRWAEVAGLPFANVCTPVKLSAGVLVISAPSAQAPLINHSASLLMERLKTAGAKVKSVRIEQRTAAARPGANVRSLKKPLTPAEEAALAQALDPVDDAGLKSALLRLGRAVTQG